MIEIARLENVCVRFSRHNFEEKSLKSYIHNLFKKTPAKPFDALKHLNLTIYEGQRIGLIGRNGAGKSTLLRVISQVIIPQAGKVWINKTKKIVPLLELGIGFDPDLTGEENCFLAGSLLGLSHSQVKTKLDRIVSFAELQEFIHQPVKTYSSGMYARLAFSLATEIEPDILIIDEVLGVGDQFFVKKSVARMQKLMRQGTTAIMVSHNLDFLIAQCNRLIWIDHGQILMDGSPVDVAKKYRTSA